MASLAELIRVAEAIPAAVRAGPRIDWDAATDAWNAAARERWAGLGLSAT